MVEQVTRKLDLMSSLATSQMFSEAESSWCLVKQSWDTPSVPSVATLAHSNLVGTAEQPTTQ
jgi:hypothetical protein